MARTANNITTSTNFDKLLSVFKTFSNIAKICGRTKSTVSTWHSMGLVPAEHVKTLVMAANGQIKPDDIRPDIFCF